MQEGSTLHYGRLYMTCKINFSEAQKRVQKRWPYLSIVEDSFSSVREVCSILDKDFGEFQTSVKNLLLGRSRPGHSARFSDEIKEAASRGGKLAHQKYCQQLGISPEESKKKTAERKSKKKKERRAEESKERKKFYQENFGVSWKGATPENRRKASERAKKQRFAENTQRILLEKTGYKTWAQDPDNIKDRVKYFVRGKPYFEYSDPVGWNRDAARFYIRSYGEAEFLLACKEYEGPRNLLEKSFLEMTDVEDFNRKILDYRPDFRVTEEVFANADGLWWHGEFNKPNDYHLQMRKAFEKEGLQILQFREDEIRHKSHIVKSMIDSILLRNRKLQARKCKIVEISASGAQIFFEENHLMGGRQQVSLGLEHDGEVVAAMCCSVKKKVMKIERFAVKSGCSVAGGLSKLLKEFIKRVNPDSVESWVDLRYGNGRSLEKLGFREVKEVLSWKWADKIRSKTYNRLRCRANMDERGLSEREHAEELGWFKIYDAGQRLYRKEISSSS